MFWISYIQFTGSSGNCVQGSQNANTLVNKYWGGFLNPQKDTMASVAICGKYS